jgi:tRNA A-37 threonylcarbamoyl transferase component Bud32
MEGNDLLIGPYSGQIVERLQFPGFVSALHDLPCLLFAPENRVLDEVRNRTVCVPLPDPDGRMVTVAVKAFIRPSRIRSQAYRWRGSKARHSWRVARYLAEQGVGTPQPLGFLERWDNDQLVESYFLTEFQADSVDARTELIRLFDSRPQYTAAKLLLQLIAREVRKLHAVGIQHNDLGHQNILVRRTPTGWENAQFIDLNRARIRIALSARQRARDVKSLWLPRSVRPLFFTEYFDASRAPAGFYLWERWYRAIGMGLRRTRDWRHPARAQQLKERGLIRPVYPAAADL